MTSPAWVPGQPGGVLVAETMEAGALRRVGESVLAESAGSSDLARLLNASAERILGAAAVREICRQALAGVLPEMGTPSWSRLIDLAAAGGVEITTVIRVREHVPDARDAAPPPLEGGEDSGLSRPGALMASLRQLGVVAS